MCASGLGFPMPIPHLYLMHLYGKPALFAPSKPNLLLAYYIDLPIDKVAIVNVSDQIKCLNRCLLLSKHQTNIYTMATT